MKTLNPLQRLIREATGATSDDVTRIENIMREEIFHSTLDWQTSEQLADGARQAQQRLAANRELYDLERQCRLAMFQKMRAEAAVLESETPANRAALNLATQRHDAAQAKLFTCLDIENESHQPH